MKGIVQVIVLIVFLFIGIPLVVGLAFSAKSEGYIIEYSSQKIETPERIKVWNEEKGKLCGDVKFEEAEPLVGAITPVPGGVGAVTTSVLVSHVVEAAKRTL